MSSATLWWATPHPICLLPHQNGNLFSYMTLHLIPSKCYKSYPCDNCWNWTSVAVPGPLILLTAVSKSKRRLRLPFLYIQFFCWSRPCVRSAKADGILRMRAHPSQLDTERLLLWEYCAGGRVWALHLYSIHKVLAQTVKVFVSWCICCESALMLIFS